MHFTEPPTEKRKKNYLPHAFFIVLFIMAMMDVPFRIPFWAAIIYAIYAFIQRYVSNWANSEAVGRTLWVLVVILLLYFDPPPQYYLAAILAVVLHAAMIFSSKFTIDMNSLKRRKKEGTEGEEESKNK